VLAISLQVVTAMKCSLQSRDTKNPGWWNLYPLMRTLDATPYQMIDKTNSYTYFFNICDNTEKCLHGAMAACQIEVRSNGVTAREFNMGMEHWATLAPMTYIDMKHANEEIGTKYDVTNPLGVKLTYHNGEGGRKTHILFPCDPQAGVGAPQPPKVNDVESPPGTYTIVFPSQHGCLQQHPPHIPQSLLGSVPLDHATQLELQECKTGSIWTHIWAVTTIFSLTAATYFWWKSTLLEKELDMSVPHTSSGQITGGPGGLSAQQVGGATSYNHNQGPDATKQTPTPPAAGAVSYQNVPQVAARVANTAEDVPDNLPSETTMASSWPPTTKAAGYHDL